MNPKNTEALVIQKIMLLLDTGFTDKDEIVSKIVTEYDLSKNVIRRIMKDMSIEMQRKIRILAKQYEKDSKK